MQRRPAEKQHGQRHCQRAAVRDDRARNRRGDRRVDHFNDAGTAHLLEVLAHAIKNDHRLVHRVAKYGKHCGKHRQRKLPAEDREHANYQDDIVQIGDDRRDRELPLEAEREIDHDANYDHQQRKQAVLCELGADLWSDELDAAQFDVRVLGAQRFHYTLGLLPRRETCLQRQANQYIARRAEVLYLKFTCGLSFDYLTDLFELRGLLIGDLHYGASGELDRQIESAENQKADRDQERNRRDRVQYQRIPHERNRAADSEEFHWASCRLPWLPRAGGAGLPYLPHRNRRQFLARSVVQIDHRTRNVNG